MAKFINKIEHEITKVIKNEVAYLPGQIVSKTLSQNSYNSLTLFAFDKNEEISTHDSAEDAMILVLEGVGKITIDGKENILNAGETIIMPATIPHSVYALEQFKMLLIVLFQ